jgi:hypothetical protein
MTPQFIIVNKKQNGLAKCIYVEKGYYLECELISIQDDKKTNEMETSSLVLNWLPQEKHESRLLIYDTLTIIFDSLTKTFISLDAFTNKMQWIERKNIMMPLICGEGLLKFDKGFEDTDRYGFNIFPSFEYSLNGHLKITLMDDVESKFYKIKDNIIVGINKKQITSFIINEILFLKERKFDINNPQNWWVDNIGNN